MKNQQFSWRIHGTGIFTYIYLHWVFAVYYTPEIQHRYQKLKFSKGFTFSKPSFWVSMLVFGSVNCSKTEKKLLHCWGRFACGMNTVVDIFQIRNRFSSNTFFKLKNKYIKSPNPCSISWRCLVSRDPSFIANLTSQNWVAQSHVEPNFSWLNSDVPSFGGNLFCPRHPNNATEVRYGWTPKTYQSNTVHLRRYSPGCLGLVDFGPFVWCKTTQLLAFPSCYIKPIRPVACHHLVVRIWFKGRSCCVRNYSLYWLIVLYTIWVFPKIMVPPNHPFVHRVFHEINHPFWWVFPLFLETSICRQQEMKVWTCCKEFRHWCLKWSLGHGIGIAVTISPLVYNNIITYRFESWCTPTQNKWISLHVGDYKGLTCWEVFFAVCLLLFVGSSASVSYGFMFVFLEDSLTQLHPWQSLKNTKPQWWHVGGEQDTLW